MTARIYLRDSGGFLDVQDFKGFNHPLSVSMLNGEEQATSMTQMYGFYNTSGQYVYFVPTDNIEYIDTDINRE